MNTVVILIACGKEEEISPGTDTAFLTMGNEPMVVHSLKVMQAAPSVDSIIMAVPKGRVDATLHLIKRYGCSKVKGVVIGGVTRHSTLKTVYAKMPDPASVIVVHEASRPFIKRAVLDETIKSAKRYGCSIAAHKLADAVKIAPKGLKVTETLERNTAWIAQTPQVFKEEVFKKLLDGKGQPLKIVDDESEFVRRPAEVHMVEAGATNMKVRSSEDLAVATALMNANILSASHRLM